MSEPTTAPRAPAARLSQDEIRGLVDTRNGTLSARIYSDPDVYDLEMTDRFRQIVSLAVDNSPWLRPLDIHRPAPQLGAWQWVKWASVNHEQ